MSIIYDALQKTQQQLNTKNQPNPPSRRNWFDITLLIVIIFLLIVIVFAYYPLLKTYIAKKQSSVKAISTPPPVQHPINKLVLNGIFVSDTEKLALINNRLVTIGDMVDGNKIIDIRPNKIIYQNHNRIFVLESES